MRREDVQVAELPASHEANKYIKSDGPVWGRRSVFRISGRPLMVCEYFLPELYENS
jgi:chorismate-pyruvate lyase